MVYDSYIHGAANPHSLVGPKHLINARIVFLFDITETNIVCRYGLVLSVHVTNSRINQMWNDEQCVPYGQGRFLYLCFSSAAMRNTIERVILDSTVARGCTLAVASCFLYGNLIEIFRTSQSFFISCGESIRAIPRSAAPFHVSYNFCYGSICAKPVCGLHIGTKVTKFWLDGYCLSNFNFARCPILGGNIFLFA